MEAVIADAVIQVNYSDALINELNSEVNIDFW